MPAVSAHSTAPASVGSLADFENILKLTRLFLADQAERW